MAMPWSFGAPTGEGRFLLGAGDWVEPWSPREIHPHAAQWLVWARQTGPSPALAPAHPGMAFYALMTKDVS